MKKAITILTICLLVFAGTQTAQAQTKEETIYWLKNYSGIFGKKVSYSEHIGDGYYALIYIDEDNNGFTFKWFRPDGEKTLTNKLEFENLRYVYIDNCTITENGEIFFYNMSKGVTDWFFNYNGESSRESHNYYEIPFVNLSKEEKERATKALIHLAELYGAKPAPKVDKNTF